MNCERLIVRRLVSFAFVDTVDTVFKQITTLLHTADNNFVLKLTRPLPAEAFGVLMFNL